jgi:aspartyl/asparaginyl beta-hydroxylase (cupin superfamily)
MLKRLHVKYPLFLSDFIETWFFSTEFRQKLKYQVSSKSVQWEQSCSMRTDGRRDGQTVMTKLTVAFRNYANAPRNCKFVDLSTKMFVTCTTAKQRFIPCGRETVGRISTVSMAILLKSSQIKSLPLMWHLFVEFSCLRQGCQQTVESIRKRGSVCTR